VDYSCHIPSPLGELTAAAREEGLTGLWFPGQKYWTPGQTGEAAGGDLPLFGSLRAWLGEYFSGKEPAFMPPLAPRGSPFRLLIWRLLREIPYGQTVSYGEIARRAAAETGAVVSPRAVGGAVGHNPLSILIPCHRVVGADGSLTGYGGGLETKIQLLQVEGIRCNGEKVLKK